MEVKSPTNAQLWYFYIRGKPGHKKLRKSVEIKLIRRASHRLFIIPSIYITSSDWKPILF